ncbi:hypothetical protein J6590_005437, partial [Homalodisca vitripennis]
MFKVYIMYMKLSEPRSMNYVRPEKKLHYPYYLTGSPSSQLPHINEMVKFKNGKL